MKRHEEVPVRSRAGLSMCAAAPTSRFRFDAVERTLRESHLLEPTAPCKGGRPRVASRFERRAWEMSYERPGFATVEVLRRLRPCGYGGRERSGLSSGSNRWRSGDPPGVRFEGGGSVLIVHFRPTARRRSHAYLRDPPHPGVADSGCLLRDLDQTLCGAPRSSSLHYEPEHGRPPSPRTPYARGARSSGAYCPPRWAGSDPASLLNWRELQGRTLSPTNGARCSPSYPVLLVESKANRNPQTRTTEE
jgi:hypothetical protein